MKKKKEGQILDKLQKIEDQLKSTNHQLLQQQKELGYQQYAMQLLLSFQQIHLRQIQELLARKRYPLPSSHPQSIHRYRMQPPLPQQHQSYQAEITPPLTDHVSRTTISTIQVPQVESQTALPQSQAEKGRKRKSSEDTNIRPIKKQKYTPLAISLLGYGNTKCSDNPDNKSEVASVSPPDSGTTRISYS